MSGLCFFFALVVLVCGGVIGACTMAMLQINRPFAEPAEEPPDSVLG